MSADQTTIAHWWSTASYGSGGVWSHVQTPNEEVAPWMLLMVIVFGFIYAVDAVVASIAVLTTLKEPPFTHSSHSLHHSHHHDGNLTLAQQMEASTSRRGQSPFVSSKPSFSAMNLSQRSHLRPV